MAVEATPRRARGIVFGLLEIHCVTPNITPTPMPAWLEQTWMVRYLDHQLASEEADWFEAYALDKPDLLATIEADTRLRDALAADAALLHREGSPDAGGRHGGASDEDPKVVGEPAPPAYVREKVDVRDQAAVRTAADRRAPAWLAMAATLVLGLGVGWIGTRSLTPDNAAPELVASPKRIIYDTMRGEPTPPRVEHADSVSPYVLIEVAVPPGAENITLKMGDALEQKLTPSPDGFVSVLALRDNATIGQVGEIRYSFSGGVKTQAISVAAIPGPERRQ